MTIKITKQLATMEDLAIGTGTVVQERNGVPLTLTEINFSNIKPSIVSMQAMQATVGTIIQTLRYYSNRDGGGNIYQVVAGGTGTADGGSFIDLNNGLQAKAVFSSTPNVEQFGARSDGFTDNTAALNAIIAAVKEFHFPRGVYNISSALKIRQGGYSITAVKSSQIRQVTIGESVLDIAPASPESGENIDNIRIVGLTCVKNINDGTGSAISIKNGNQIYFSDVSTLGYPTALRIQGIQASFFYGLKFAATSSGLAVNTNIAGSSLIKISGHPLTAGGQTPVYTSYFLNTDLSGNSISEHCLEINQSDGVSFVNGYFAKPYNSQIKLEPTVNNAVLGALNFSDIYFDGVQANLNGSQTFLSIPLVGGGVTGTTVDEVLFSNCFVHNYAGDCVKIEGQAFNLEFKNTTFKNILGYGVNKTGNQSLRVSFSNCNFREIAYEDNSLAGIFLDNATTVNINDCNFDNIDGTGASAIRFNGAINLAVISTNTFNNCPDPIDDTSATINTYRKIANVAPGSILLDKNIDGNFTPFIQFGGQNVGVSYSTQTGTFERVGGMVIFSLQIELSSKGSSSGNFVVTGLPISANAFTAVSVSLRTFSAGVGEYTVSGVLIPGFPTVSIDQLDSAGFRNALTDADVKDGSKIYISGVYRVS